MTDLEQYWLRKYLELGWKFMPGATMPELRYALPMFSIKDDDRNELPHMKEIND